MRLSAFSFVLILVQSIFAQPYPYKNLSVNKDDIIDSLWNLLPVKTYPHAQSNSECRGEPWFRARCAISDTLKNTGHGSGFPSWGPDQRTDIWWKVLFGKNVWVDSITIHIRADFPHDGYWFKGRFNFSDGSNVPFALDSTAKPQGFKFTQRTTNYVLIDSLVWRKPTTWCAFTQVRIFGRDQGVGVTSDLTSNTNRKRADHARLLINPGQGMGISKDLSTGSLYMINGRTIEPAAVPAVKSVRTEITR
jgi:hypothetical protein